MSEEQADYITDAMEMTGKGYPVVQLERPSHTVMEVADGYEVVKSLGWVKFSADFRKKMLKELKGAKLSVFICVCLHINEDGTSFPGIDLIATETGYDRDTVMIAIKEMEGIKGLLSVTREVGKSNKYRPYYVARGQKEPVQKIRPVGEPVQKIWTGLSQTSPDFLDYKESKELKENGVVLSTKDYQEVNAKVDAILTGGLDPLRLREKSAIDAFESAFGVERPWNWYPAKTTDEKTWRDFRAYVLEKYEADPQCFTKYVTWRNQKYSKGTMSNLAIKRSPQDFPDSWVMFLASESMYGGEKDRGFDL